MKNTFILLALVLFSKVCYSQLNPMGSVYYHNQYLANPAMAGVEPGWELNGGIKSQWSAIDGAPLMEAITLTHGSQSKKVGLGFNFFSDKAGVIQRTSAKASYAYHLPLNGESSYLDFGLSAGILDEWIDFNRVRGDLSDQSLYNFNQRKVYFDSDFGVAYRNEHLTIQGSVPNLKRFFKRDATREVADRALFMGSVSYLFETDGSALNSWEPKAVFRGVQNYKNIVDLGLNLNFFENKLIMSGIYHSTNSVTVGGAGTMYKKKLTILTQYTTNTADLQNYSNGEAEIAIKYNF